MKPGNEEQPGYERVGDLVSIFLRGGTWQANFQQGRKQRRQSLKTKSKKTARQRAIQLEAALVEGRYEKQSKAPGIVTAIAALLKHLRTERRAKKTIDKCETTFRRVRELADERKVRSLLDIDVQFVDAYRQKRAVESDAAEKTIHNETVIIRQLINFALSRRMISVDPLRGLRLRKPKPRPQPCWTKEQVGEIIRNAPRYREALTLLAETGMRVGELKWLTWADVDLEHGVLHVRAKEGWQPKTGDQRVVPLSKTARAVLERLPRPGQWVVTAALTPQYPEAGRQISERRLLQYLKRVLKKLELRGHLHTFRHSFISYALTRGTAEAVVREWVGHVDRDVIKLYTHIADRDSQAAMARLADSAKTLPVKSGSESPLEPVGDVAQIQHTGRERKNG